MCMFVKSKVVLEEVEELNSMQTSAKLNKYLKSLQLQCNKDQLRKFKYYHNKYLFWYDKYLKSVQIWKSCRYLSILRFIPDYIYKKCNNNLYRFARFVGDYIETDGYNKILTYEKMIWMKRFNEAINNVSEK